MTNILKHIYFIRHGESEGNAQQVYQTLSEPLTERGRGEAQKAGERLHAMSFDAVLASDTTRTVETANAIADYIDAPPIEAHEILREIKRPSEFHSESVTEPWTLEVKRQMREHADDPDWRWSDEENMHDQIARAQRALMMLADRTEEYLLVVTHGTFLRIMIGLMLHGEVFSPAMVRDYNRRFKTWNASISYAQRVATDDRGIEWQLVSWNEQFHLPGRGA